MYRIRKVINKFLFVEEYRMYTLLLYSSVAEVCKQGMILIDYIRQHESFCKGGVQSE